MKLEYQWVDQVSQQEPASRDMPVFLARHVSEGALGIIRASDRPKLVTDGPDSFFARLGLVVLTSDELKALQER